MQDLTEFQRDLLFAMAGLETSDRDEKPHGLAIKGELEDYYGTEIHHGRLYPNLDTLVNMGLIEKGAQDKRTNFYQLKPRGWRELEARMEWQKQRMSGHELETESEVPA